MITVDAHKLAYCALPKAGCTSVKQALARLDPDIRPPDEETEAAEDVRTWHEFYPTSRMRPRVWRTYTDHWRFCVIRDPLERLLSCYTDLVAKRRCLSHSPQLRASGLSTEPDPDGFLSNLVAYRRMSSVVRNHALGMHVFLGPSLAQHYDRVYRLEELPDLGRDLSNKTGKITRIPHRNASEMALGIGDLKGETLDRLRSFLDEEYSYAKGYYDNPLGRPVHGACAIPRRGVS